MQGFEPVDKDALLAINPKLLNPSDEVRRVFGSRLADFQDRDPGDVMSLNGDDFLRAPSNALKCVCACVRVCC